MSGYVVDLAALTAVGQYIASEEDFVNQAAAQLASVSDLLGSSVQGIDTSAVSGGAGEFAVEIQDLAKAVAGYGTSVGECARAYGVSDAQVEQALGALA